MTKFSNPHVSYFYWLVLITPMSLQADSITSTISHPYCVTNRDVNGDGILGEWVAADDLQLGDRIRTAEGKEAILKAKREKRKEKIVESEISNSKSQIHSAIASLLPGSNSVLSPESSALTTYNFSVADWHTYFVGEHGLWVHNQGAACSPDSRLLSSPVGSVECLGYTLHSGQNLNCIESHLRIVRALGTKKAIRALLGQIEERFVKPIQRSAYDSISFSPVVDDLMVQIDPTNIETGWWRRRYARFRGSEYLAQWSRKVFLQQGYEETPRLNTYVKRIVIKGMPPSSRLDPLDPSHRTFWPRFVQFMKNL